MRAIIETQVKTKHLVIAGAAMLAAMALAISVIAVSAYTVVANKRIVFFQKKEKVVDVGDIIDVSLHRMEETEPITPFKVSRKDGPLIVTNMTPVYFTVENRTKFFLSDADFRVSFFDSWHKKIADTYVSITFNTNRGMNPGDMRIVRTSIQNFDRGKCASWRAFLSDAQIQRVEGQNQKAVFAVTSGGEL